MQLVVCTCDGQVGNWVQCDSRALSKLSVSTFRTTEKLHNSLVGRQAEIDEYYMLWKVRLLYQQ